MMSGCKVADGYGTILVICYACLFRWKELCFLIVILKYLVSLSLVISSLFDNSVKIVVPFRYSSNESNIIVVVKG